MYNSGAINTGGGSHLAGGGGHMTNTGVGGHMTNQGGPGSRMTNSTQQNYPRPQQMVTFISKINEVGNV